jgi:hypothetical protein
VDQVTGNYTFAGGGLVHEHAEAQFTDTTEIKDTFWVLAPGGNIVTNYSTGNGPVFDHFGSSGPFPFPLEAGSLSLQNPDAKVYYPASASEGGNTKVGYFVGGTGQLNQQVLLAATATVQEGLVQKYNGYNVFCSGATFTNSQVVDGDLEQQGSDGWAVKAEPAAGGMVDVTPTGDPPPMQTPSWPNTQPYAPTITANRIVLSNNVVATGADFCVGQGLTFDVTGLNPNRYTKDDIAHWTLPGSSGKFVNRHPDTNCDFFYDEDDTLLNPPIGTTSTNCWYVLDAQQATVSVTISYDFRHNGPTSTQTITGKFNVHRPVVVGKKETIEVDGDPTPQISPDGNYLSLGVYGGRAGDMSFKHRINPGNFSGDAGYVQLVGFGNDHVHSYCSWKLPNNIDLPPNNNLDTLGGTDFARDTTAIPTSNPMVNPFYWVLDQGWTDPPLYDGPYVYLADNATPSYQHLHFHDYLMFKPQDSSGGPSIYVPLQRIDWELYDEGWRDYHLDSSSHATITSDSDCSDFPHWNGVANPNINQPEQ